MTWIPDKYACDSGPYRGPNAPGALLYISAPNHIPEGKIKFRLYLLKFFYFIFFHFIKCILISLNAQHFTKIREAIIDAYGYFYQYHNRNQIKLVGKRGLHPEVNYNLQMNVTSFFSTSYCRKWEIVLKFQVCAPYCCAWVQVAQVPPSVRPPWPE